MANSVKNIIVGAARVYVSNGTGPNRPDLSSSLTFPWNVAGATSSQAAAAASVSTPSFLEGTAASAYWRDLGFTNTGVEVSYEPGYNDVMVDQLLDAARLFKHQVKVLLKTELTEGTLENLQVVLGQTEQVVTYSPGSLGGTQSVINTLTTNANGSVTQLNLSAGALGDAPVERTMVLVGNAPAQFGTQFALPSATSSAAANTQATTPGGNNTWGYTTTIKKERVYVARRIVQIIATQHGLKRDGATVFPVQFRCLPDDLDAADGSEYGFIIDRIYG